MGESAVICDGMAWCSGMAWSAGGYWYLHFQCTRNCFHFRSKLCRDFIPALSIALFLPCVREVGCLRFLPYRPPPHSLAGQREGAIPCYLWSPTR